MSVHIDAKAFTDAIQMGADTLAGVFRRWLAIDFKVIGSKSIDPFDGSFRVGTCQVHAE